MEFADLSKKFVMVNVEDDEEPTGSQFVVDGEYVPRVFFMGKHPIYNCKILYISQCLVRFHMTMKSYSTLYHLLTNLTTTVEAITACKLNPLLLKDSCTRQSPLGSR